MDINKIAKESYRVASSKGFSFDEDCLALLGIASEVNEALENYEIDVSNRMKPIVGLFHRSMNEYSSVRKQTHIVDNSVLRRYNNRDEELIDILLRTLAMLYSKDIDIEKAIESKLEKNRNREYLHGNKF